MSSATFKLIGDYEIPPDFSPAYVAERPALKALVDKAPPRAHAAIAYLFARGEAEGVADAKAKARLSVQELSALAKTGDEGAAAILEVREESLEESAFRQLWTPETKRMAASAGLTEQQLRENFKQERAAASGGKR
jgi:hypothetical protein